MRKPRTEVDAQVGVVAEIARSHGLETPVLRHLQELIHDIEEGRRDLSGATFDALIERSPP